jgi:superfamily II DNA or RNA helicase
VTQEASKRRFDGLVRHQLAAVEHALRVRRCSIQIPTGGGKTLMAAEIIRRTGYQTLWMVQGDRLIDDTIAVLRKRLPGVEIGKVGGGKKEWGQIVVGSVRTLINFEPNDAFWNQFELLIVDELQHMQSDTWYAVASRCKAMMRVGLSGTINLRKPDPLRTARIEGMTGPTYEVIDHETLSDLGFIARPRVVFLRPRAGYPSYTEIRDEVLPTWREDPRKLMMLGTKMYAETYRRGVIENKHRNLIILQTTQAHALANDKVVVLLTQIAHAQWLAKILDTHTAGRFPVRALNGKDKPEIRDAVLEELKEAKGGFVLFATPFFREGLDIPEIDVFMLGGGGKSDVAVLQAVGRALRPRPDKPEVLIYDFLDGIIGNVKGNYLFEHFQERLDIYKQKKFSLTMPEVFSAS